MRWEQDSGLLLPQLFGARAQRTSNRCDGTLLIVKWWFTLFYGERWDFYPLNLVGLHVGSPRTEIAPSPSWKMLETNVKNGKIMENTGKIGGKTSSSHLLRILQNGYNGPVGAAEADTDLSIFSSDPEAKGIPKTKTAEVGCGWLLGNTEMWIELYDDYWEIPNYILNLILKPIKIRALSNSKGGCSNTNREFIISKRNQSNGTYKVQRVTMIFRHFKRPVTQKTRRS